MNMKHTCFASVVSISEIQQSEIYLTIKARLFETPGANLNGVRVTAAFLDEIIANEDRYIGIPLYADARNLAMGNYEHLGHLYDARTGEFHSTQIGSFYKFEKETTAEGFALVGYARIMKRNKAICKALSELFATGALKFSFEISCGSCECLEDGTMQIDADPTNYLEGMAVVTFPACEGAVALQLVAECNSITDDECEEVKPMNDQIINENIVAEAENAEIETAEEAVEEIAEVESEVIAEEQTEEDPVEEQEETQEETEETEVAEVQEQAEEVAAAEETEEESCAACGKKKSQCACWTPAFAEQKYNELVASYEQLKNIVAEIQKKVEEPAVVVAETETVPANPFISEIKLESKYTLLDSDKREKKYSLLEKA